MIRFTPIFILAIVSYVFSGGSVYAVESRYMPIVQNIIDAFKSGDGEQVAKFVRYPLARSYPLPAIKGPKEFAAKFRVLFDRTEIERITQSDPKKDWADMGWRGIMFNNGDIWIDTNGFIESFTYSSAKEIKEVQDSLQAQKSKLYPSLRNFNVAVLDWETKNYRVRIDELKNRKFRYAAWKRGQSTLEKPSIVLTNGFWTADGNGGNHFFTFVNGHYRYVCYVIEIGESDSPPGTLEVYKGKNLILSQDVLKER